jgi:asparagine synthase (glutamine-hydrolysing)
MANPVRALAQAKGFRVMLTGLGGDDWLTGSSHHAADLFRTFRLAALIRQVRIDARVPAIVSRAAASRLFWFGFWPLVPQAARRALRRVLRRNGFPRWIDREFAHKIRLSERLRPPQTARRPFSSYVQADLFRTAISGFGAHFIEIEERSASRFGFEQRHPFHDQRIIEFALALPEEQRWRGDQIKFILRQAMRGFLPETIRQRVTKAEFSHVFAEALRTQGGEQLFGSLTTASMGWVEGEQVKTAYRDMARLYTGGDNRYTRHIWSLWLIFGIELWFNAVCLNRTRST